MGDSRWSAAPDFDVIHCHVRDGEVGFLGDTVEDLAAVVKRVDLLDRARCRKWVETRFSVTAMADRYEAVYRRLR